MAMRSQGRPTASSHSAITKEIDMSTTEFPEGANRPPSAAEDAMEANARSRDRQGKAEDHARRQRHVGMMGGGPPERDFARPGDPAAQVDQSESGQDLSSPVAREPRSIGPATR
jgi:hypothetical protein